MYSGERVSSKEARYKQAAFFFFFLSPPSVALRCFSVSLEDYRSEADVRENEQSIINAGFLFCLFVSVGFSVVHNEPVYSPVQPGLLIATRRTWPTQVSGVRMTLSL